MTAPVVLAALLLAQQQGSAIRPPAPTAAALAADTGALRHANGRTPPVARAYRIAGAAPHVDSRLDDSAWSAAEPITEFTQYAPNEGQPATERTEVRILYDDEAVYVGAWMFDGDPSGIITQLGRRDSYTPSDRFTVSFDSYHDHRTSFQFSVNPSGVKSDRITSNDQGWGDDSWDPVWDVATRRDSLGWAAEMRIPLSQLRFPPGAEQVWGINVSRYIQRKAESAVFAWSALTEPGFTQWFAHLFGLAGLPQPRRLEILPYATAREERIDPGATGNPFNDGSVEVASAGLDLKYGLTSNLTVDATFNPDFGQVEADPAVVNLTAYESFFQERRPFFVEGASIFGFAGSSGFGGTQYFYSRRIGRAPQGFADPRGGFVDMPVNSTILGAAKLSGRTGRGWSIGLLEAVTAREHATVEDSSGVRHHDEVEPLTTYTVARGKRDFGGGASTVGFIATGVNRDIRGSQLHFLRTAAYAGGVDFSHRFRQNRYSLSGSFGLSYVRGDTLAIQRAQRSSARYYQRPDADYVEYDPARTSLTGWTGQLSFGKIAGNWTYSAMATAVSPGFDLNDAGFQTSADDIRAGGSVSRRWTRPGTVFRYANLGANTSAGWNFGGVRNSTYAGMWGYGQLLNYWSANVNFNRNFRGLSDGLTRGGPLAASPASWNVFLGVNSDYRKPYQGFVGTSYSRNGLGGWGVGTWASLEARLTSTVSISAGPDFYASRSIQQYVTSQADTTATATFGRRYVFAEILQRTLGITTRLNVTLTPTLSLQLYMQPFVAAGDYGRFKELRAARTSDYLVYGDAPGSTLAPHCFDDGGAELPCGRTGAHQAAYYDADPDGAGPRPPAVIPNPDFAFRSLRGNAVLRWEYRPGSTLFLVWTTNCSAFGQTPTFRPSDDLGHLCQGTSNNVFAVKFNYWLSL